MAGRHHPLGAPGRVRSGDPEHHRRPLPALCGVRRESDHEGRRRRGRASTRPLRRTGSRHRCSPTTPRCSRAGHEEAVAARSRSSWRALGVAHRHSTPYHPQTCGKVERFHQTEKKWLAKHPKAKDIEVLQEPIDRFRSYYNAERPHRALRAADAAGGVRGAAEGHTVACGVRRSGALPGAQGPRRHSPGKITLRSQQPAASHRPGPSTRTAQGPRPCRGSPRPGPHRGRRAAPRSHARSDPDYQPHGEHEVKDVPRHVCTMSRDITHVPGVGFEPTRPFRDQRF